MTGEGSDAAFAGAGRALAVVALLVWCALLVLSAWPARTFFPNQLALPNELARTLLGWFAMTGGISVFDPPRHRLERIAMADCIWVRARDAQGGERLLHPPEGVCQVSGLRLAIPRLDWVQRDLLIRSTAPLNQAVIGDYWCRHAPGAPPDAIDVLWTQPWFERTTGEPSRTHVAFFRWQCAPPALLVDLRAPGDEEIARHGASLPPPVTR